VHLLHSLTGKVPVINGAKVYVDAGGGGEYVDFPESIDKVRLYYTEHLKPLTLPRYVNTRRIIVRED